MAILTGVETLDEMLHGGYPEDRAVAVAGARGTGKTTLAMQFLQQGLTEGDRCVFLSSERGIDGLYHSFSPFGFDLYHDDLRILSFQAGHAPADEDTPVVSVADDRGASVDMQSFTDESIRAALQRYEPFDRAVVDSVPGLALLIGNTRAFRHGTRDLIRVLTHEFEATTVLTANHMGTPTRAGGADTSASEIVQHSVDGIIRLWRERRRGELRRFVDIMNMRGVDHDTRQHEIQIGDDGVEIVPRHRVFPSETTAHERLPTGIDGFDELLGGGLPTGKATLLTHDGAAHSTQLAFTVGMHALEHGLTLVLIPRGNMSPRQLNEFVSAHHAEFTDGKAMLDAGRLVVLDLLDMWPSHEHVYTPDTDGISLRATLQSIRERTTQRGLFLAFNTEIQAHAMATEEVRRFRYWLSAQFLSSDDVLFDVHNPETMRSELAEMYGDAASVGMEIWLDDTGLQYLRVNKAPVGTVGRVRLIADSQEQPYIQLV